LMQLNWSLAIRTDGPPDGMVEEVRRALREVDRTLPVINVTTVDQLLGDVLVQERLMTQLATWFGGFALLLAALGVYGVVSFAVTCRTNEIGVRMALGAQRRDVLSMVLNEGLLLVIAGIVIGLPVTLGATRMISSTLFGVNAADPLTITGATLLMLAVAACAAVLPAYRASRVDPMIALRCE
jgi:ABC-type antimicrobial peptide transport system permease subunit